MSNNTPIYDSKSMLIKKCRVCGDKASAFNFNGLSCESCKSFFRRNANRESELECTKNGKCEITIKTRKFCAKCRLSCCLKIGMKKEFLCKRKYNSLSNEEQELKYIKNEILNSFNSRAVSPYTNLSESSFSSLTNYEKIKIEEVSSYYNAFKEENTIKNIVDINDPEKMLEYGDEYCKFLIEITKKIPGFKSFPMCDKLIMAKNFLCLFFEIRYIFFFDKEGEYSLVQNINDQSICFKIPFNIWNELIPDENIIQFKDMIFKYKYFMMNDPIIRDLLATISLYREHEKITCLHALRLQYLEIYYLIKRYLQVTIRNREKYEKHLKLFHDILALIPKHHELCRESFQFMSSYYYSELLAEIYEL